MLLRVKIAITLFSAIITTLGQSLLLHLLFPNLMAAHEIPILIGLLLFNCGVGVVFCFST